MVDPEVQTKSIAPEGQELTDAIGLVLKDVSFNESVNGEFDDRKTRFRRFVLL